MVSLTQRRNHSIMDRLKIYDKLRKVVHSVQTKEQLYVAIRYADRAAKMSTRRLPCRCTFRFCIAHAPCATIQTLPTTSNTISPRWVS